MNNVIECPYKTKPEPVIEAQLTSIRPTKISKLRKLSRFISLKVINNSRQLRQRNTVYTFVSSIIACKTSKDNYKPVVCIPTLAGTYCFISDLEIIRSLLRHPRLGVGDILSEGRQFRVIAEGLGRFRISKERSDMKQKRSILAHLLANPTRYLPSMNETSNHLVNTWKEKIGKPFIVTNDVRVLTLSIYLQSVMNYKGSIQPLVDILEKQIDLLGQSFIYKTPKNFEPQFRELRGTLVSYLIADEGLQSTTEYTKQLSEYIDEHYKALQEEAFSTGLNGATLAGYLAPAPSFIATVYELGKNAVYQDRLFNEFQQHLADGGSEISYIKSEETLLHACIHEVLRLHPSQPFIFREAAQDCIINDEYLIPKKAQVVFNFYHLLRNEKLFGEQPETFRPERFIDEPKRYLSPFLAYSAGPNNCTGQFFSRLSLKVFLLSIISNFHWKTLNDTLKQEFHFALAFGNDVEIILEKRQ